LSFSEESRGVRGRHINWKPKVKKSRRTSDSIIGSEVSTTNSR